MSELGDIYWQGCAEGKLLFQACAACGAVQTYPRPFCECCGKRETVWHESARRGKVVGHSTVYRAPTPDFETLVPYRLVLVDLDEGTRIIGHGDHALKIGDRIEVGFFRVGDRHLPFCTPA